MLIIDDVDVVVVAVVVVAADAAIIVGVVVAPSMTGRERRKSSKLAMAGVPPIYRTEPQCQKQGVVH